MTIKPEDMQGKTRPIRVDYSAVEYKPEGLTLGCARWLVYGSTDAPRRVRYFPPGQEPVVTIAHDYDLFNKEMTLARPEGFECERAFMLPWPGMLVSWDRCELAMDMLEEWQWTECSKFWEEVHKQELELDRQWEANAKAGILPYEYGLTGEDDE